MPSGTTRPRLLTAADSLFFRSLWQFMLSAERTGVFEAFAVRAYDLGLRKDQSRALKQRFARCELVTFDFTLYPAHVSVAAKSYAWKAIIIADNVQHADSPVFWFDSATLLKTRLEKPLWIVAENGIWILKSQSPLHQKCDPRVLDALQVPLEVRHVTERAAGAIGIDPRHAIAKRLAQDWKNAALNPHLIVPEKAAPYHKQDQALLNCLLFAAAGRGQIKLTEDEIDISSAWPTREITTRNRVAPFVPVWADLGVRLWFSTYKALDQLSHRWRNFHRRRIGGLHRWWKEHFTVHVSDPKRNNSRAIPSPSFGYYADPFPWIREGNTWLFMEEYQYAEDRGRLVAMELSETLEPISVHPLSAGEFSGRMDCHSSFPFLFELDGNPHLIPETCERKSVDLYICTKWPDQWRLKRRLLFDVDAADTMVVRFEGLWWLFTSVRKDSSGRHLEIYFTDDLEKGVLHPHPQNRSERYGNARHGTGRNAGHLAFTGMGGLLRLMQYSERFYGEGVCPMKLVKLTRETFKEEATDGIPELPVVARGLRTHHVARAGDVIAYDVRDRAR